MIVELPEKIYMNTVLDKQIKIIENLNFDDDVEFSFERVNFILPESTIILIALSKQAYMKTKKTVKWIKIKESVRTYMERIEIQKLEFISIPTKKLFAISRMKTNNLVEMRIMKSANQYEEMISDIKRILEQWFSKRDSDGYVKQITRYIQDIAANSLEHSEENEEGICYFTLQKYNHSNGEISIHVAFGDVGMGIYKSIIKKYPDIDKMRKRPIVYTFIDGNSCRGNENGGLGFRNVKKQLEDYGGDIQIRSGKEMIHYYSNGIYRVVDFKHNLIGTQTSIILR